MKTTTIKNKIVLVFIISALVTIIVSVGITNHLVYRIYLKSISRQLQEREKDLYILIENTILSKKDFSKEMFFSEKKHFINKILYIIIYDKQKDKYNFFSIVPNIKEDFVLNKLIKKNFFSYNKIYIYNLKKILNNNLATVWIGYDLSYFIDYFKQMTFYMLSTMTLVFFILLLWIFLVSEKISYSLKIISNFLKKITTTTTTTTERLNLNTNDETSLIADYINKFLDIIQKNTVSINKLTNEIQSHEKTKEILSSTIQTQQIIIKILLTTYINQDLKFISKKFVDVLSELKFINSSKYFDINLFLVSETEHETLELVYNKNSTNSSPHCTKVKFGECYCGKAVIKKDVIFDTHESAENCKHKTDLYHYHYCIPLIYEKKALGVLEISFIPEDNFEFELQNLKFITPIMTEIIQRHIELKEKKELETKIIQQSKLASIGQLAAGIAHELNNPLTTILGNTQMLIEENPSTELKDIEESAKRMQKIVLNLLEFSRQKELLFENININTIIDTALELVGKVLIKNNVEIKKYYLDNPTISASKVHLEQVFVNIFTNSSKAMLKGGKLIIKTEKNNSNIVVTIKDTGIGISKENLSRVMEPFFTTDIKSGTGLGLSISNEIIKKHNGELSIISDGINKGTEVKIVLPIIQNSKKVL